MTTKKSSAKKASAKKIETDEDRIKKARKKRLALASERVPVEEKCDSREDFRKYFLTISKKLKLNKSLEEVIWIHLKTIKCNKKELFEKGIKHFGYKI